MMTNSGKGRNLQNKNEQEPADSPWNLSESFSLSKIWRNHLKAVGCDSILPQKLRSDPSILLEQDREPLGHFRVLEVGPP